ncbi:MAG: CbtB-domain containing protein [Candidatus Nitrosocosmicus sp.]
MSTYNETIVHNQETSKIAIGFLAAIVVFGLFVVGYDQGHIFSLVQGSDAFNIKYLHEFTHDMRHASGFPCH